MASVIQATGSSTDNATSCSQAFGSNVTSGNLGIVMVWRYTGSAAVDLPTAAECTKSAGTATIGTVTRHVTGQASWTSPGDGHGCTAIFSFPITGTGSLTMNVAGAPSGSYHGMAVLEANGYSSTAEATNSASDGGTASPVDSGNATSAGAALFVGCAHIPSTGTVTITVDGAFTLIFEQQDGSAHETGSSEYKTVASGNTDSASWTYTGTSLDESACVTVFPIVAAGGLTIPIAFPHYTKQMAA